MAYESGSYQYEYYIRDHLGNVRQVVRAPQTGGFMATMEMPSAQEEELLFEQLPESRQGGAEHNVTPGGDRVAWLNASRGRVLGPARIQEVQRGDSIRLSVHGKYKDVQKGKANIGSFISAGAKDRLVNDLLEFGRATARSAEPNAVAVFNIIDLLISGKRVDKFNDRSHNLTRPEKHFLRPVSAMSTISTTKSGVYCATFAGVVEIIELF